MLWKWIPLGCVLLSTVAIHILITVPYLPLDQGSGLVKIVKIRGRNPDPG
jgi:hypothetical protein